ncbi:type II secretion system minor pseudopilin GspK [Hyphomonas sp.]|uniref:type II secretion system minor pseudopilin GspK n=1 Tax=Hyphomonas sp. TaxID=87 RepID=UPI0025C0928B|nr:type II secretion system minor pseudopilin GspK [Hyphomonas sp.]
MIPQSKQAGAALLSILLIVATLSVAALMATDAIARQTDLQKLSARRTSALWAARSAEAAALAGAADLVAASRLPASSGDTGREQTLVLPVESGQIILTLRELPPCLNLNALAKPEEALRAPQAAALAVLLEDIGVPLSDAAALAATLGDWIDADQIPQPGGGEDAAYLASSSGTRTAGQPLRSPAELAPVPGYTPELIQAISPFTCTVPLTDGLRVNVNALTAENASVLRAATRGALSAADARRFIEARPASGWNSVQDVAEFAQGRQAYAQVFAEVPLAVRGEYFTGEGSVELDAGRWPFRFILHAGADGAPRIVWRSFGDAG